MQGDLEFKQEFLKEIEEQYPKMLEDYKLLFSKEAMGVDNYEIKFKKDFYSFNREQIMEMFKGFRSSSIGALAKRLSLLQKYSAYAYERRKGIFTTINTQTITRNDLKLCVSENKQFKRNMTKKELYTKLPMLLNESDKLLLILYFKGLFGTANSDIINLKKTDFDYSDNTLFVGDKIYQFNNYEAQIIQNAISESFYVSYMSENDKSYDLVQNEYIFRNLEKSTFKDDVDISGKIKNSILQRRVVIITQFIGKELWSSNTIYRSGIASRILKEINYGYMKSQDLLRYKLKHGLSFDHVGMIETMDVIREKIREETEAETTEN